MITVTIPEYKDIFIEKTNEFITIKGVTIQMEHSLISLRKWESKWHKPFLGIDDDKRSEEETIDYMRCMTITPHVDPMVYYYIPKSEVERIAEYIKDPMTATWIRENPSKKNAVPKKRVITAELIYYWMIELGIPIELERWHLNQLLMLIRVINVEREPAKKRSKREILSDYSRLNEQRRAMYKTKG